jgi:hypothetical protein
MTMLGAVPLLGNQNVGIFNFTFSHLYTTLEHEHSITMALLHHIVYYHQGIYSKIIKNG